jgi:EmrB/QacA subfamily drug resistance transporter
MSGTATTERFDVETAPDGATDRRRWLVLLAMVFGLFMPMLDHLVVNVALPTIQRELGAGISGLQWIVDAYTLTFAALLLTGGSLGDLYGRKRFYLVGLTVFTIASAMSGFSTTTEQLVATRALQGVGAALLVPGTLSIISSTFSGKERGAAIGIWGAIAGLAIAVGPVVGGYLVEHVSWESVFFINVPIGIVALVFAAMVVPESRDRSGARRVDPAGLVFGTGAVSALTYALIEGNSRGWTDARIVASFIVTVALVVAFLVVEARSASPMLPLSFFRNRTFSAANVVAALMFFAMIGTVFFLALYLQNVRGYSPTQAGLRLLPFSVTILVFAPIAGKISDRKGSRGFMSAGPLMTAAGLALLLSTDVDTSYAALILPAFVVMGIGWAITLAPMTSAVMGSVEPSRAGIASAVTNTSRELGGVLGVAAVGALVTSTFTRAFTTRLMEAGMSRPEAAGIVARVGGGGAAGGSGGGSPAIVDAIQRSFVDAIHRGMVVSIVAMVVAAIVSSIFVRSHVTTDPERR